MTLPAQYIVTTLAYRNGYLYVGTKNIYGDEAKVFIWDGATANADYEVPIGGSWVFSLKINNDTVSKSHEVIVNFLVTSGNSRVYSLHSKSIEILLLSLIYSLSKVISRIFSTPRQKLVVVPSILSQEPSTVPVNSTDSQQVDGSSEPG